jgi:hypothetical protein
MHPGRTTIHENGRGGLFSEEKDCQSKEGRQHDSE